MQLSISWKQKFPSVLASIRGTESKESQSDAVRRSITLDQISPNYLEEVSTNVYTDGSVSEAAGMEAERSTSNTKEERR